MYIYIYIYIHVDEGSPPGRAETRLPSSYLCMRVYLTCN